MWFSETFGVDIYTEKWPVVLVNGPRTTNPKKRAGQNTPTLCGTAKSYPCPCYSSSLATPFGCAARDLRWRQWHQEPRSSRHQSCLQRGNYTSAGKNATNKWGTLIGMPIEMRSIIGRIHTSNCNVLKDSLVTIEHLTHLFEPVSLYLRKCTCMCLSVYVISVTSDFWNISTFGFRSLLETQAWSM